MKKNYSKIVRFHAAAFLRITANDKINALTLSPLSGLVSWLNWTKAPRNFFTLVNALFESCKIDGVDDCCVDATEVGGGVVEPNDKFLLSNLSYKMYTTICQEITIYYRRWATIAIGSRWCQGTVMLWRNWRFRIHYLNAFGWVRRSALVFTCEGENNFWNKNKRWLNCARVCWYTCVFTL